MPLRETESAAHREREATVPSYRELRDAYLEEHPHCQIQWDARCRIHATEIDHWINRSQRRDLVLNPKNFRSTCRPCHNAKHANPAEAFDRGLAGHAWDEPATLD